MSRPVTLVDVFASRPFSGNALAVVHQADDMDPADMLAFTRWMNMSECTFLQTPTSPEADYRVRIFTPAHELPFAGHPTLGTCHAWLEAGGQARQPGRVVQECGAGLVVLHQIDGRLAFEGPPVFRDEPVTDEELDRVVEVLGIEREAIVDARWTDNGPGWVTVLLADADAVLAVNPVGAKGREADIGVAGLHAKGQEAALEIRAFFTDDQFILREDPVTGSLNAAAGAWLVDSGRLKTPYVAAQGTAMGRAGRVYVDRSPTGALLVGGETITVGTGNLASSVFR